MQTGISGFPHASMCGAKKEHERVVRAAGNRNYAPSPERPDKAPFKSR
jgi:hypothetical protein